MTPGRLVGGWGASWESETGKRRKPLWGRWMNASLLWAMGSNPVGTSKWLCWTCLRVVPPEGQGSCVIYPPTPVCLWSRAPPGSIHFWALQACGLLMPCRFSTWHRQWPVSGWWGQGDMGGSRQCLLHHVFLQKVVLASNLTIISPSHKTNFLRKLLQPRAWNYEHWR